MISNGDEGVKKTGLGEVTSRLTMPARCLACQGGSVEENLKMSIACGDPFSVLTVDGGKAATDVVNVNLMKG
jgi:hypothetical protein